jgi:stress-induced morphogen
MTPSELVHDWLGREDSQPAFGVQGLSLQEAQQLLQVYNPLLTVEVPSGMFDQAARGLRPLVETLIDRLIRLEDLTISDELQDLLDRGLYNPRLSDLFEKLWSARFQHVEKLDAHTTLNELLRETFEDGVLALRCDALLFWLTLMGQNYAVAPGQLNLIIRGRGDEDLVLFLLMAETWHARGCPLRSLVLLS